MQCHSVQNKILSLTDPRVIPESLLDHLARCPSCRAWVQEAGRLEGLLEQLPVPLAPAGKKEEMIAELTGNNLVFPKTYSVPARAGADSVFVRFLRQNRAVIGGIAAAVLVVLGGVWLFTGRKPDQRPVASTPNDPFLEKLTQRFVALSRPETPLRRLELCSELADDISTQERTLARIVEPDGLMALAVLFEKVVNDGMVKQAERMSVTGLSLNERAERKKQLAALAAKLGDMATQAEKMKGEVSPDAKPALEKIEDSARRGEKSLQTQVEK
jgi:hypothetical protein